MSKLKKIGVAFILSVFLVVMSGCIEEEDPIISGYYNRACIMEPGDRVYDFDGWSQKCKYEEDAFDCSRMSARLEHIEETCGHDAKICTTSDHAFLLLYLEKGTIIKTYRMDKWTVPESGYYPFESTEMYFPHAYGNEDEYVCEIQYESIHDIWDEYKHYSNGLEEFDKEWNWYLTLFPEVAA